MGSLFKKLVSPNLVIVGEVVRSIRSKLNPNATHPTGIFPDGSGYRSSFMTEVPTNLNNSGYYDVKTINIGITDINTLSDLIRSSAADENFESYENIAAVSLDGLFVPYTIDVNHTYLPHFESPTSSGEPTSVTLNPFNPNNALSDGELQTGMPSGIEGRWLKYGHNIGLATSQDMADTGVTDLNFEKDFWRTGTVEKEKIRSIAMKAPMILSGWGFDTDGNPVPSSGTDFHPEAFWNPSVWKTGPLDARWDSARKVWAVGGSSNTKIYLVKVTNTYNPYSFSYEVDRSNSRVQFTRFAPETRRVFSASAPIYDPEYLAYVANSNNNGTYEQLDYTDLEFPHYEAFIVRETIDPIGNDYYNIWTEDCQDCGHVANPCPSGQATRHGSDSTLKKILIENPLRQGLDTGDLAFTVKTGRSKDVNTGTFVGGSGVNASGNITVNTSGYATFNVSSSGNLCANITLHFNTGVLASGTISPSGIFEKNRTHTLRIYPANSTPETESLDIHWILQAEFKSQQVVSHVECDGGILQACVVKLQTQGFKSCEWCGEDTTIVNSF